ncbi:hypothetical protein [Bacillus sp. FJAT-27445]|uniref:hypothetical protein n=1 Tax=Bacillus sp. FJAT-27445 TaxID=1679166 RepID=UPI0007437B77|nr:hypothetical protein [Bacillus sp. FJAT-27445]
MSEPRLRKLGNLFVAGRLAYKKLGCLAPDPDSPGILQKKEDHLEEPGTIWYSKTASVKPDRQAIRLK